MRNKKLMMTAALTIVLLVPRIAAAAGDGAEEPAGVLPPVMRDVLVILGLVLGVLLLIAVAFLWTMYQQSKEQLSKLHRIPADVKAITAELRSLQSLLTPAAPEEEEDGPPFITPGNAGEPQPVNRSVWQAFVEDYNNLAHSMSIPKAEIACESFIELHKLLMLECIAHSNLDDKGNETGPKYVLTTDLKESNCWAWLLPEEVERYAVVPNPIIRYDDNLHSQGGMKETFASNFESGDPNVYEQVEVKLPAIFNRKNGDWKIEQPGLIRVTE